MLSFLDFFLFIFFIHFVCWTKTKRYCLLGLRKLEMDFLLSCSVNKWSLRVIVSCKCNLLLLKVYFFPSWLFIGPRVLSKHFVARIYSVTEEIQCRNMLPSLHNHYRKGLNLCIMWCFLYYSVDCLHLTCWLLEPISLTSTANLLLNNAILCLTYFDHKDDFFFFYLALLLSSRVVKRAHDHPLAYLLENVSFIF